MRKRWMILLVGLGVTLSALSALAQEGVPEMHWWALSNGGTRASTGDIILNDTLGQPFAGRAESGTIELDAGYWHRAASSPPKSKLYLPLVLREKS